MIIIALSGPSGVGKNSILRKLAKHVPNYTFSISCTTRAPRPKEKHGEDYFFLSHEEFDRMVATEGFAEWKQYGDHKYGTPSDPIREAAANDEIMLMDLEVEGARDLRTFCHNNSIMLYDFFIMPPSIETLRARLLERGTEDAEAVEKRIERGREEILCAGEFTHTFTNDDLDECTRKILDEFWFC